MSLFTFHLVETSFLSALKGFFLPPKPTNISGLIHSEYLAFMTLGSPIFSPQRMQIGKVVFFAQWENEAAFNNFLKNIKLGKILAKGWYTKLIFLRQWGYIDGFKIPEIGTEIDTSNDPVVAFTIARMKPLQIPRFLHWGRPVERLVRDHPGTSFSSAAIRLPNTVSTFSVWKSQQEMLDMVHGHSSIPKPERHSDAMKERERKNFHFQFTTLRFKPIAEFGEWESRTNIIPFRVIEPK